MRLSGSWWVCSLLALASAAPAASQELRGFLVLEGDPGYLTNPYLDPGFATWAPEVRSGFGSLGATGLLEWAGEMTRISVGGSGRWIGFADSTASWRLWSVQGSVERRIGDSWALLLDGSNSEIVGLSDRRTLWGQLSVRWTVSPRVRLSLGPGVARRRFFAAAVPGEGELLQPPLPGTPDQGGEERSRATSYLLFAGMEVWPGVRWRVRGETYAAHTEVTDLGIDYRGGGGRLRVTRWLPGGVSLTVVGGLEGFRYRAAVEAATRLEVPEDDLIWRAELGLGWPLGRRVELRGRVAGLGRPGAGAAGEPDLYASAGIRLTLGGSLTRSRPDLPLWTRTEVGMRIRVRHDEPGRLYLVGDFNDWGRPGVPLRREDGGIHVATLRLEPGSYRYRIRLVRGEREEWLQLPKGVPTVEDGFGERNGLLVVEDESTATERESSNE